MLFNVAKSTVYCCLLCICILKAQVCFAQATAKANIEKALAENKLTEADALVQKQISFYYARKLPDSLNNYVFYVGKIAELKKDAAYAIRQVEAFISKIKSLHPLHYTLRQTYIEAGEYYGFAGKNNLAYKANEQAYRYTLSLPDKTPNELAAVLNNMSTYAQRMGDLNLSQGHARQALNYLQSDPHPNYEKLYIAYNGMGATTWYASKLDSSLYFFNKAVEALNKTEHTPLNQFYRVAVVQNNIAGIYGVQGKTTEAIKAMKDCIANLKKFISSKEPHLKKNSALSFQFEATDNLAGIYKELGDYKQAEQLLLYSYEQKQKKLGADDPAVFISQILLGQLYYAMKEFAKALHYLNEGAKNISKADGDYLYWQGDAAYSLALLYDERGDEAKAAAYYEKADSFYEASLKGEYDNIYLEFLRNAALFYAENKMLPKALAKANKGYNYVVKTEGTASLLHFYQLLNLSEVHFAAGKYMQSLAYSTKALAVVNTVIRSSNKLLDSIHIELKKPKAILLKAKCEYSLLHQKDRSHLSAILTGLKEALSILEKRKSVLHDAKDIELLMADHADLLAFIKKITLDLYSLTHIETYADELISLHESGMYNRIRSRLDKSDAAGFANLPATEEEKEKSLKAAIAAALSGNGTHDEKMQAYLQAEENWNNYLNQLRKEQPRYYKMRYASIFKSVSELQPHLPQGATIVRYFFVGKDLLALVADKQEKHLIQLPANAVEENITALSKANNAKATGAILQTLYLQLWQPLAKHVRYKRIIIIPDGILYNLSFELLTPQKIGSYKELLNNSLLARHTISYQYSLFLLDQQETAAGLNKNFVAFAPGFSDEVKKQYELARDTSEFDNGYLSLLPQPFTVSLATKAQKLLNGNAFIYDQSTSNSFRANAGQHKIIHIGTHAEANNLHPEFSRLIFAKNTKAKDENNSLYLFDIYNCDLSSNLTVLTACETGVPGYEDGEGMLSLAHAFSYAGSESIITSLAKIDEQSSATIMDAFYKNLLKGLPKDEALREAKLSYLSQASGRALAPQYWAGLVLMGNTSPVIIETKSNMIWLFAGLTLLLICGAVIGIRSRQKLLLKKK